MTKDIINNVKNSHKYADCELRIFSILHIHFKLIKRRFGKVAEFEKN